MHYADIKEMNIHSDAKFTVTYEFGGVEQRVTFKVDAGDVNATVHDSSISIADLLDHDSTLSTDTRLSQLVVNVRLRLANHHKRLAEMQQLAHLDAVTFDAETNECLISCASGRVFAVRLDASYPLSGTLGLCLAGIEPSLGPDELASWQVKIDAISGTLAQVLQMLE